MNLPVNNQRGIPMNVAANQLKCTAAELKYEQLLSDKYFVETCFSKKHESYTSKNKLTDLYFRIDGLVLQDKPRCKDTPVCSPPYEDSI